MKKTLKIDVLGTPYDVVLLDYKNDPYFEKNSSDGYCDCVEKRIVICNMQTFPTWDESEAYCREYEKTILRHELIHAFLNESGLRESAHATKTWAMDEEMVDWLAIQIPKIVKAMKEAGCIES